MPFGNYDELLESVENWLARGDLKEDCPDFIHLAEAQMALLIPKLRLQDAIKTGELIKDQEWIPVPEDLIEPRFLRINSDPVSTVDIVSIWKWQDVVTHQNSTQPIAAHIHGDRIYLGRTPGIAIAYDLFYKGGFPRLGAQRSTNFILEQFPMCYLYGALANAATFIGSDERVPGWLDQAQFWYKELKRSEARARTGGGRLRIRPDHVDGSATAFGVRRSSG